MANDILIIGAGPLGLSLALALKQSGRGARIVDARPAGAGTQDGRVLALSEGSRQILSRLLAFPAQATPIKHIHISQQGGFGRTRLDCSDYGLPALGYVARAADLIAALTDACRHAGIAVEHGVRIGSTQAATGEILATTAEGATLAAQLIIRAEGALGDDDEIASRDYRQDAILCTARPAKPHGGVAFERFTPQGPYALLPLGADYSVVATVPQDESDALLAASDEAFLARLEAAFGSRVALQSVGPRSRYPLRLRYRKSITAARTVWLGNAAQTLHPVAGQGFNLALRDVWALVSLLATQPDADPGAPALLARYEASRRLDRRGTIGFTDLLIRLFANRNPLLNAARGAGLLALDLLPPARDFVARRMMLGARGL